jgi:hypothetical protein
MGSGELSASIIIREDEWSGEIAFDNETDGSYRIEVELETQ